MTYEIWMPFYGRIDHFKLAVQSVIAQDDPDWKLTVVDDVYPDLEPGQWLVALNDPRITYIRNDENLRPSRNYNKCASLTTAEFITIMGCDDVMLPGYVARVKQLLAEFPDADIVQPGVSVIDENGVRSRPLADRIKGVIAPSGPFPRTMSGESLATSLLRGNWTYFPSLVWRAQRIRDLVFRTDLDVVQDLAMLMAITLAGGKLIVDNQPVFEYRRHSSSVSSVTGFDGSKFRQERTLFYELVEACRANGWFRAARTAKHHMLSRANALREIPQAFRANNRTGRSNLTRHVLRRPYRDDL